MELHLEGLVNGKFLEQTMVSRSCRVVPSFVYKCKIIVSNWTGSGLKQITDRNFFGALYRVVAIVRDKGAHIMRNFELYQATSLVGRAQYAGHPRRHAAEQTMILAEIWP